MEDISRYHGVDFQVELAFPRENSEMGPPNMDSLGLGLQECSGGAFLVGNLIDVVGTTLVAHRVSQGAALILFGGAINAGALLLFSVGHSMRNDGEMPALLTSAEDRSYCGVRKEDLIKFLQYGCAYSTGIASVLEAVGTRVALNAASAELGKNLLLAGCVFSSMAFPATLGEIFFSMQGTEQAEPDASNNGSATDITVVVQGEPAAATEQPVDDVSCTNWCSVYKCIKSAGIMIFSAAGVVDPMASAFTNFSPIPLGNTSLPEDNAGAWAITASGMASFAGSALFLIGYLGERRSAPQPGKTV